MTDNGKIQTSLRGHCCSTTHETPTNSPGAIRGYCVRGPYVTVLISRDDSAIRLSVTRSDSPETTRAFIAALKSAIPSQYRTYDPATRVWTLTPARKYDVREYYRDESILDMDRMLRRLRDIFDRRDYYCANGLAFCNEGIVG